MTLAQLADIATIAAACVAIASLIFIWVELRRSTKLNRAGNVQALATLASPLNLELITNREVAMLWVEGANTYTTMDAVDKYRYESLITWWLILHENVYIQRREGLLTQSAYDSWLRDLKAFIREQRLALFWNKLSYAYDAGFAGHVSDLILELERAERPDANITEPGHLRAATPLRSLLHLGGRSKRS